MLAEKKKRQELEDAKRIKTIVKTENNNEIFLTDAPDVDFDQLNEEQA